MVIDNNKVNVFLVLRFVINNHTVKYACLCRGLHV